MSLIGTGGRPDFTEAEASESRGRRLRQLVLVMKESAWWPFTASPNAQGWVEKRVMMPADEPESFALDAKRVIAYPDIQTALKQSAPVRKRWNHHGSPASQQPMLRANARIEAIGKAYRLSKGQGCRLASKQFGIDCLKRTLTMFRHKLVAVPVVREPIF